jgi:hypothetical protein
MAFAVTLPRSEWIVTWFYVDKYIEWKCVRLIGNERKSRPIDISDVDEVLAVEDSKRHLVLVDGWKDTDKCAELAQKCHAWFEGNEERRRLAFVCSVASRGKMSANVQILTRALEFRVWSWTLEEYHGAIEHDDVFQNVSQCLDVPTAAVSTSAVPPDDEMARAARDAMVKSKYYYAGGSCRYMFLYDRAKVMTDLISAVDALPDAATVTTSGQSSVLSINRLFGMFEHPSDKQRWVWPVISQFAATLLAVKCGPDGIKRFMVMRRFSSNPALDGWMLEMVFFASLEKGGLLLFDKDRKSVGKWDESNVLVTDGIPALSSDHPVWIRPERWNQGGYDAIMVCKRKELVRFPHRILQRVVG